MCFSQPANSAPRRSVHLLGALLVSAAAVLAATAQQTWAAAQCTAVVPGSFCLANCDGTSNGLFLASPPLVTGLTLSGSFQLDFDPAQPYQPKVTTTATVALAIPAAFSAVALQFTGAGTALTVYGPDGAAGAYLGVPDYNPRGTGSSASSTLTLPLSAASGDVLTTPQDGGQAAFANFMKLATTTSGAFKIRMAGYADTRAVASQDGQQVDLCLRYVEVDQSTALEGLGGLTQASIAKPVVKGGSADKGIELSIPLTIVSPSKDIVLNSNTDAVYAMQYQGATVGSVIVPQFSVRPGTNTYTVQSFVKPDTGNSNAVAATRALLTAFTGKQQVQIQAVNGRTSGMPSLDAAFGAVSFNLALPPNTDDLIVSTSFRFPNLLALTADANLVAHNAFDAPVGITHITATLTYSGMTIGTVDADIAGFTIAAKGQATSPTFTLKLKLDVASIKALLVTIVGKPILVNVASTLTVNFGGYSTVLDYTQNNVPTTLNV